MLNRPNQAAAIALTLSLCAGAACGQVLRAARSDTNSGKGGQSPAAHADYGGRNVAPLAGELSDWVNYVPREPMWAINASGGIRNSSVHPEDNDIGIAPWWRGPRAVDNLLTRIDEGYRAGARWFFINRPMGALAHTHVPGASWLTLSDSKREELPRRLADALLDRFDEPVNIVWFIGSDLKDPRSIVGWNPSESDRFFQVGKQDTWKELVSSRATLGGWLSTGAAGLGIDHSAPVEEREHFIGLFHQLIRPPFSLMLIGEALPLKFDDRGRRVPHSGGDFTLEMNDIKRMPWLAIERYVETRFPGSFADGVDTLDPDTTRVYMWFEKRTLEYGNPEERIRRVDHWMDRGFIPITYDAVMFRHAQERLRRERGATSSQQPERNPSTIRRTVTPARVIKRVN